MKTVILTLDAGVDDLSVREREWVIGLRLHRLQRIAAEAFQQGGLLTCQPFAQFICLHLRSSIKDMRRTISHCEMIVKHWLPEIEVSEIARKTNHSIEEIANAIAASNGRSLMLNPTIDIRLYDGLGNLVRQVNAQGGTVQFDIVNLPDGIYYLHVYDGVSEQPTIQQIIIQH